MATIPPSQTLYIRGLNEKIHKEELRKSLYYLFSQHGRVLDVVAMKTIKMRGQAFVAFRDIPSATSAMRSLQGFPLHDKPMKITYAKAKSNALKLHEGSYTAAPKPAPAPIAGPAAPPPPSGTKRPHEDDQSEENKRARSGEGPEAGTGPTPSNDQTPPNHVLFLQNLPLAVSEDMLAMLFQQYAGYKEIRMVTGRKGVAFVEYETAAQAEVAKQVLHGFKLTPTHAMSVEFAKPQ